jgi:hypothetical protein
MKKTKGEIAAEIAALEALQPPPGRFQSKQRDDIELMISTLKGEIDMTSDEFNEMNEEDADTCMSTQQWADGHSNDRPSEGWKGQW